MRGSFRIDAGSVGTTGESCVWRGSKLFFGRGSGKFCGKVSGSDSNRFSGVFLLLMSRFVVMYLSGVSFGRSNSVSVVSLQSKLSRIVLRDF